MLALKFVGIICITQILCAFGEPRKNFDFPGGFSFPSCGQVTAPSRRNSIKNTDATPGHNPYHANIVFTNFRSKYLKKAPCGGTLISKRAILTSGHCLYAGNRRLTPDQFQVTLGAYNVNKPLEVARQTIKPISTVVHPSYNHSSLLVFGDNLALLIFNESAIQITEDVKPACLWSDDFDTEKILNVTGEVVGWSTDANGTQIDELKQNHLRVTSSADCEEYFKNKFQPTENFCIAHTKDPEGCAYDDGAGFVINKNGRKYLRGVLINGLLENDKRFDAKKENVCVQTRRPLVTDLDHYIDWIIENVPDISRS
ncbi:serine protease gd-like [Neocloeon triangulifer]|uniref:serine protease gd-like n=1 Tax=Neocloeon triangulifer TaxID=2078957 RepID=UPI00286F84B6|nr:serine protease gd-like [Neocloeon triangulifer]